MSYGSGFRYKRRLKLWEERHRVFPRARHHVWWLLHNCVSHPILGVHASERAIWFHDWTSMHLNCRLRVRPSAKPVIQDRSLWAWHNIAGHLAIGLVPVEASFAFHDRTSEAMNVPRWV
jgi:hypothetical protein